MDILSSFESLTRPAASGPALAQGEVITTSPLSVRFAGTAAADAVEGVALLSTYTPTIGDAVLLVQFLDRWIALGAV